jgi:hypothetical protein
MSVWVSSFWLSLPIRQSGFLPRVTLWQAILSDSMTDIMTASPSFLTLCLLLWQSIAFWQSDYFMALTRFLTVWLSFMTILLSFMTANRFLTVWLSAESVIMTVSYYLIVWLTSWQPLPLLLTVWLSFYDSLSTSDLSDFFYDSIHLSGSPTCLPVWLTFCPVCHCDSLSLSDNETSLPVWLPLPPLSESMTLCLTFFHPQFDKQNFYSSLTPSVIVWLSIAFWQSDFPSHSDSLTFHRILTVWLSFMIWQSNFPSHSESMTFHHMLTVWLSPGSKRENRGLEQGLPIQLCCFWTLKAILVEWWYCQSGGRKVILLISHNIEKF